MPRMGRDALRVAVLSAVVSSLAYLAGSRFTALFHGASAVVGGLWSLISAVVVMQATRRETTDSAWRRLFGTLVGAILSGIYLAILPFSLAGMAVWIRANVLADQALGAPDPA